MNKQSISFYGIFLMTCTLCVILLDARNDKKKIFKPKNQGVLLQSVEPKSEHAIDSLSSLSSSIDLTKEIDTLIPSQDQPIKLIRTDPFDKSTIQGADIVSPLSSIPTQISLAAQKSAQTPNNAQGQAQGEDTASKTPENKISDNVNQKDAPKLPLNIPDAPDKKPKQQTNEIKKTPESSQPQTTAKSTNDARVPVSEKKPSLTPGQKTELEDKRTVKFPYPFKDSDTPSIEFYFENTDLQNLVNQISDIYKISFITDESITPLSPGGKALKGNKISFKTQKPLTKKEGWNLFLTFLDLAGLTIVPTSDPTIFRIMEVEAGKRSAIPAYIGVDPDILPDNDQLIRYVYFIENSTLETITSIINSIKNPAALFNVLQESKAFILTDKAYNIKMLMTIIKELDKTTMPQALSVLKLRKVDAKQVADLYQNIVGKDDTIATRLFPNRKQPTSLYFPENTRIFAEPRTNTLILLGPKDSIKKIEDFITTYIDIDIDKPYSPLNIVTLQYADANTVAEIMNNVTDFGRQTEAGKAGGVRGEDKYMKPITFTPQPNTNQLIIRGEYEDYKKSLDIIKKLDEPQPQVAIEMLVLSVSLVDNRQLGTQLRSAVPGINGLVGPNTKFQTSGINLGGGPSGIVENTSPSTGVNTLLGNLLNLLTPGSTGANNTVVSLGFDQFGVWGIFHVLQTISTLQVISNPFVTATNKTPATVKLGETRRVVTAQVVGGTGPIDSFGNFDANLEIHITPQINSDGFILLNINFEFDNFLATTAGSQTNVQTRTINTSTIVADREVLAFGGLIQNTIADAQSKVPILGDIPILGWLFKNKQKSQNKNNLLVLVSTRIIHPEVYGIKSAFTQDRIADYRNTLNAMESPSDLRDPVYRGMFASTERDTERIMDDFIFKRQDKDIGPITDKPTREMGRIKRKKLARKEKRKQRQLEQMQRERDLDKGTLA